MVTFLQGKGLGLFTLQDELLFLPSLIWTGAIKLTNFRVGYKSGWDFMRDVFPYASVSNTTHLATFLPRTTMQISQNVVQRKSTRS